MQKEKVINRGGPTLCSRCAKKLNTGDDYAVEELSVVNHRFYHWECIKKDPETRNIASKAGGSYVEYNQASAKY